MAGYTFSPDTLTAWVDIETTGLDYDFDKILEVGVILTRGFDMEEVARTSVLTRPTSLSVEKTLERLGGYARDMHEKSGLIDALTADDAEVLTYREADDRLTEFIEAHVSASDGKPWMAGSSITFDRTFLQLDMPTFVSRLHHRSDDITSITHFLSGLVGTALPDVGTGEIAHRSLDDLDRDIAYWRSHAAYVRQVLGQSN